MRLPALVLVSCAAACHVNAEVKGSANAVEARSEQTETVAAAEPAKAPAPAATPEAAPSASASTSPAPPAAPPASACPLSCYVASGGDRISVSDQEQASIQGGLEPVLARMRACTDAESWRRHGSPTIHLRVAPDGAVAELDVDPEHAYEREAKCVDDAVKGAKVSVSLPGRTTVRCVERCSEPRAPRKKKR